MVSDKSLKLSEKTKSLVEKERSYDRETYDSIVSKSFKELVKLRKENTQLKGGTRT